MLAMVRAAPGAPPRPCAGPLQNGRRPSRLVIGSLAVQKAIALRLACRSSSSWRGSQMSELPDLTKAERKMLKQGRHVQRQTRQGPQGNGLVVFDVHAPASLVLDCLADFANYPAMIPVVRKAHVHISHVADDGTLTAHCSYRISRFYLSVAIVHSVSREQGLVRFDLDPTISAMMLKEVTGFWYVEPLEGSDCSRVWLKVDLCAANWLPHWLIDYASERALNRATSWLTPKVEQLWSHMAESNRE
ncbi:unnamed protein product [Effrenium voratum]|nr:unnamed protein product [Effrenium voratum]